MGLKAQDEGSLQDEKSSQTLETIQPFNSQEQEKANVLSVSSNNSSSVAQDSSLSNQNSLDHDASLSDVPRIGTVPPPIVEESLNQSSDEEDLEMESALHSGALNLLISYDLSNRNFEFMSQKVLDQVVFNMRRTTPRPGEWVLRSLGSQGEVLGSIPVKIQRFLRWEYLAMTNEDEPGLLGRERFAKHNVLIAVTIPLEEHISQVSLEQPKFNALGEIESFVTRAVFALDEQPFIFYQSYINKHRVDVISNQSGSDHLLENSYVDTALNSSYSWEGNPERCVYADPDKVYAAANDSPVAPTTGLIMVIVNDSQWGGCGGDYAVFAAHPLSSIIAIHESGHSFVDLADEYFYDGDTYFFWEPAEANLTIQTNRSNIKWKDPWLGFQLNNRIEKWRTMVRVEHHWLDYEALIDFNLRNDLKHPGFKHEADAKGYVYQFGLGYDVSRRLSLDLLMDIQNFQASRGVETTLNADNSTSQTQLNHVNWESFALMLGATMRFE